MTAQPGFVGEALVVDDVSHTYQTGGEPLLAISPVQLTIEAGAFVCLVGPSGCGKSTLLEILAGLRTPTAGEVRLGGRRVVGPGRRRGVVCQQPTSLFPWRSVADNVGFGLEVARVPRAQRAARVAQELERVGLSDFASRRVYELSGGMQQRTQIARALANDPEVLLLDEPFGALDTFTRERLQEELRSIWLERRPTIVFVTHSVEEAALLSTKVVVMSPRPGRVSAVRDADFTFRSATAAQLRSDPDFIEFVRELRQEIGPIDQPVTSGA